MRLRLELARGHGILRRRLLMLRLVLLLVGVPLRLHVLHVLGIAVGRAILLGVVVLRVGVVVHRRVRLRVLVVVLLGLSPPRREVGAWHHGRRGDVASTVSRRPETNANV